MPVPALAIVALAGLGLGALVLASRDRAPSHKVLGIPASRALEGTITAAQANIETHQKIPMRVAKLKPSAPALKVWGTEYLETGATFVPAYMKSDGCKDFRWGVCVVDMVSELEGAEWFKDYNTGIRIIGDVLAVGAGTIAKWLTDRMCARFKWPLQRYKTLGVRGYGDGSTVWRVNEGWAGLALVAATPPHPLPPKSGYRRVWIDTVQAPGTRNEHAIICYWPTNVSENPDAKINELLPQASIRAMLRMAQTDPIWGGELTGAITAKILARAACGKSKWWLSGRKKAMREMY